MNDKLEAIGSKLSDLRRLDVDRKLFGADHHQYVLNPVVPEATVIAFETQFGVVLPVEYRRFLCEVGNGGAGPYYGLEPLENALFADLDHRDTTELINPSLEFPLQNQWNLYFEGERGSAEFEQFEDMYFDAKWVNGLIRISNFGCGVSLNLVVNGSEYGNVWVDDRCNDGGVYPDVYFDQQGRTSFLTWYELWLDSSLNELG